MHPLGPYKLSAAPNPPPITVDWEGLAQPPIGIDLKNISGLLLQLQIAGQETWLLPWTARYFPTPANIQSLLVLTQSDITPTAADPLTLVADVYQQGDNWTPPPSIDRSLTGLAAEAAISGLVDVSVANTPTIDIAAGQSIAITGTPTVNIGVGQSISIAGTPTVTLSGPVSIAAGQAISVSNTVTVTPSGTVNVQGVAGGTSIGIAGTVSIATGQSIAISGTPTVNIASGQSVSITSGTVSIGNTPTINIAAGQAVSVSNTVTVTPSGTVNVQGVAGGTSIGIAGTVSIATGQSIAISGTPTVNIAAGQNIAISGTPTVNIASGQSVSITSGSVNIGTVSGTVVSQLQNQTIGTWAFPAVGGAGASQSFAIPANVHSVKIFVEAASALSGTLTVVGNQSSFHYLDSYQLAQNALIALPFGDSGVDTSWTFTVHNTTVAGNMFIMGSTDPSLIPVTTLVNDPLWIKPISAPDQYASIFQGGNTTHTLITGPLNIRLFSAWCGATPSGAAPGGSFGCFIQRSGTGDLLARVQLPNALVSPVDSNSFQNGLYIALGAGDNINLVTDNAPIFGWGGVAYTTST